MYNQTFNTFCQAQQSYGSWIYKYYTISAYLCKFESRSGEVYSIQHYVIKFVSDLRQISGFPRVLRFSSGTPVSSTNKTEILLKVALKTTIITQTNSHIPVQYQSIVFIVCNLFSSRK